MPPEPIGENLGVRKLVPEPKRQSIRMTADRILVRSPKEIGDRKSRGGILIPATVDSETKNAVASGRGEGTTGLYL